MVNASTGITNFNCWLDYTPRRILLSTQGAGRQFCVFCGGLGQDGDVGVGVFPEGEESGVGGAGFWGVADEAIGAGETEMGQSADGFIAHHAMPIQDFLKLRSSWSSLMSSKVSLTADIDEIEVGPERAVAGNANPFV